MRRSIGTCIEWNCLNLKYRTTISTTLDFSEIIDPFLKKLMGNTKSKTKMIEATPDVKIETSSSIPSIYDYFPKLLKTLKKMKYQGGSLEEWLEWTEEHFKSEIDAIISEEWALLKTFNDGIICGHTICMLYSLLHDSYRFALLSKTD